MQLGGLAHLSGGEVDEVIKPEQKAQKADEQHDADFPHAPGQHDGGVYRRHPDEQAGQKQRRDEQRAPDGAEADVAEHPMNFPAKEQRKNQQNGEREGQTD